MRRTCETYHRPNAIIREGWKSIRYIFLLYHGLPNSTISTHLVLYITETTLCSSTMSVYVPAQEAKEVALFDTGSAKSSPRPGVNQQYHDLLEKQASQPDKVFIDGHELQELDANLVVLNEHDHEHPRVSACIFHKDNANSLSQSWPTAKKVHATAIVGGCCFLAPFASTIFAPSIHIVMQDLNITDSTIGALQVSIFLFALAIGPLVLAPLSEKYGRPGIVHFGNFVFVAFSIGGGFTQTATQFSVCRFIAGFGGSAAISVVGGFVVDIWDLAARPKASGLVMLGP
jgi:hypothetical protein